MSLTCLHSTLKKVLLPTFGTPTIPILRDVPNRPKYMGDCSSSTFFFGGMATTKVDKELI